MSTSKGDVRQTTTHRTVDRKLTRYDVLLLLIPAAFVLALLVAQVSSLGAPTLLAAASLVGAVAMADALFLNPPLEPGDR